jgi:hypothetical protein
MGKLSSIKALLKRTENRKIAADLRLTVLQREIEDAEQRRWELEARLYELVQALTVLENST